MPKAIIAKRGQEQALARQLRQLHRGHRTAAATSPPGFERGYDLPRRGHALNLGELAPLRVPDHRDADHGPSEA